MRRGAYPTRSSVSSSAFHAGPVGIGVGPIDHSRIIRSQAGVPQVPYIGVGLAGGEGLGLVGV
jgi:hypothetical protein